MPWTEPQQKAIDERHTNLLVSAAAGSGKTAVLVERIIRLIIGNDKEPGVDVDRFLVVTFTKAAASEMKEKLTRAIRARIRTEEDPAKRQFLRRQVDRMYMADISTFHSFAIELVREFFQYAEIDPGVRVIDEGEADILLWDAVEDVFFEMFEEGNPAFLRFLDRHSKNAGEDALKRDLLADYLKLRSYPHYFEWVEKALGRLSLPLAEAFAGEPLAQMRKAYTETLSAAAGHLADLADYLAEQGIPTLEKKMREQLEGLREMENVCRSRDDFRGVISAFEALPLRQKDLPAGEVDAFRECKPAITELYKSVKEPIKDLKDHYLRHTDDEEEAMMRQCAEDGAIYLRILQGVERAYEAQKRDRRAIDFSDIEHLAMKVLEHDDAAAICREKYAYIFIDEYQDSNYLQEEIISRIAAEDNLFMVGDVKQSIYRFRMAEPDIFLEKYQRYGCSDGPDEKIDLSHNFRSKRPVIDSVNHIFAGLMEGYDDNAALRQGAPCDKDIEYPVEMVTIDRTAGASAEETDEAIDEQLAEMKWQEKEAIAIVKIIKESLGQPFYDNKNDTVRSLALRDIVILMRSIKTAGPIYKDVFRREGLGLIVEDTSSFFEKLEIQTFLDLLRVLDNPRRDLALLGVLRSFFFDFSLDELICVRMRDRTVPYYEAFDAYALEGEDAALRQKCAAVCALLEKWRRLSAYLPLDEFVSRLVHDTGYYAMMGALPGGEQRQANLRALSDKTSALMQMGRTSIQDLLRYVEAIQARGEVNVGKTVVAGEQDDVVRMMTIHKSKGLEFPFVFVSGLGAGSNLGSKKGFAMIDREMGIALPFTDEKARYKDNLLLHSMIVDKQNKKTEEEDQRVLYVALTRARDRLVMTAAINPEDTKKSYYYHMIEPYLEGENCPIKRRIIHPATLLDGAAESGTARPYSIDSLLSAYLQNRDADAGKRVEEILGARYPFEDDLRVKSKYSVTELYAHDEKPDRAPLIHTRGESGEQKPSRIGALALGTALHTVLEKLPFAALYPLSEERAERIEAYLDELCEREILTEEERRAVDPGLVERFLGSVLAKRIAGASKVSRETPFSYLFDRDGREILVQGVIDCWFEEPDGIVLVDYKSNMKTEGVRAMYQEQIDLYREALAGLTGKKVKEAYLYMIRTGEMVDM